MVQLSRLYEELCRVVGRPHHDLVSGVARHVLVQRWLRGCIAMLAPFVAYAPLLDGVASTTSLRDAVTADNGTATFGVRVIPDESAAASPAAVAAPPPGGVCLTLTLAEFEKVLRMHHGNLFTLDTTVEQLLQFMTCVNARDPRGVGAGASLLPRQLLDSGGGPDAPAPTTNATAPAPAVRVSAFSSVRDIIGGTGRLATRRLVRMHAAEQCERTASRGASAGVGMRRATDEEFTARAHPVAAAARPTPTAAASTVAAVDRELISGRDAGQAHHVVGEECTTVAG